MMIFREVKRVLKKEGSFWLNISDTYSGSGCGAHDYRDETATGILRKRQRAIYQNKPVPQLNIAIPPKCMVCIPERVMFAMIEDKWILRNKIVWHKPNSMPSSVKDRFTCTWEYLYFFTKARRYYFDLDAVRVPHKTQSLERYQRGVNLDRPAIGKSAEVGPMQQYPRYPQWFGEEFPPDQDYKGKFDQMFEKGSNTGEHNKEPYQNNNPHRVRLEQAKQNDLFGHEPNPQSFNLRVRDVKRGKGGATAQSGELKASEKEAEEYEYPEKDWRAEAAKRGQLFDQPVAHQGGGNTGLTKRQENIISHFKQKGSGGHYLYGGIESPEGTHEHPLGKNPGDIIQVGSDTHRKKRSVTDAREEGHWGVDHPSKDPDRWFGEEGKNPGDYWELTTQPYKGTHFAVYPEKLCMRPILASSRVGDTVLDPFAGSGTTGVVAKRLGRKSILIDCVENYCRITKERISKVEYQPELEII